ncbi:cell surface A33 antigen-like [Colossoma macropomum]|uniref:cell surface A33 antigen-like n=1 Tax=Colossoma macropomum TaxID=42526 RepID=UPI0018646799|nr:cell surface A33 antigen-like [Colossoma macropomum]
MYVTAGCTVESSGETLYITAHKGESVMLPCHCTDLHPTPQRFTWKKYKTNKNKTTWEVISSESGQYRNRVQLVNGHSPGNLSLLISHLTEEDGGSYQCKVKESGHIFIRLTIEDCTLEKSEALLRITACTGGSVLLPCYCTDLHTRPGRFTWRKYSTNRDTYEEISSESGQYRNRVQLVNGHSPGNLSLLISHLTEEDGGDYRCDLTGTEGTDIRLTVEESPQSLPFIPFALVTVIFLHIIVAVVYHTKRDLTRVHYRNDGGDGVVSLE